MDSDDPDAAPRDGSPRDGQSQRVVKLSVGGARFQTTLGTLRRFPGTFLEAMFSGRFPRVTDDEGWHFIDRDGTHFRHILNFLREPSHFECEASPGELRELRRECRYYGLDELMFPAPAAPVVFSFRATLFKSGAGDTYLGPAEKRECVEVFIELRSADRRWYMGEVGEGGACGPAVYCEQCRYWLDARLRFGFSSRTQRLFNAMAPTALALDAWSDWIERRLGRGDVPPHAFDLRPCPKCRSVLALFPQDECDMPLRAARGVDASLWPICATSDIVAEGPRGGRRAAWAAAVDPSNERDVNLDVRVVERDVALEVVDPGGAPARPPLPRPQSDENFDETGSVGEAWAAAVRDGATSPPVGALRG